MLFYTIEFFRGFLKIFLPDPKKKKQLITVTVVSMNAVFWNVRH